MDRLQTLIKKVHKRLDARGRSQKALLNQQANRYRLAEKAKRDAEREERRKEHAKQLREASGLPPVLEQGTCELDFVQSPLLRYARVCTYFSAASKGVVCETRERKAIPRGARVARGGRKHSAVKNEGVERACAVGSSHTLCSSPLSKP